MDLGERKKIQIEVENKWNCELILPWNGKMYCPFYASQPKQIELSLKHVDIVVYPLSMMIGELFRTGIFMWIYSMFILNFPTICPGGQSTWKRWKSHICRYQCRMIYCKISVTYWLLSVMWKKKKTKILFDKT